MNKKESQILCISCNKNKAQQIPTLGYMPCKKCIDKNKKYKAKTAIEIVTEEIKEGRKEFKDDIRQRYRGHTANKAFIEQYGTKGFTEEEVRNARYVDDDSQFYKTEG